ncbi:MAG: RNA polymerase sigma factor [Planctomycetes bacterium]|nr:RNA polymerase sigma factor [Planctomycetota bacterium]
MFSGSDTDLLERTARGDRDAFETLVRRNEAATGRFLARVLPADRVHEARNTTFLRVFTKAGTYGGGSVKSWIFKIAWRCAADLLREGGADRRATTTTADDALPARGLAPDAAAALDEERFAVRLSYEKLDAEDRALLWLCVVEGLALDHAARILQKPPSTLRYRLAKALERVRSDLVRTDVARTDTVRAEPARANPALTKSNLIK